MDTDLIYKAESLIDEAVLEKHERKRIKELLVHYRDANAMTNGSDANRSKYWKGIAEQRKEALKRYIKLLIARWNEIIEAREEII